MATSKIVVELLTIKEVADTLRISERTVYRLVRDKALPSTKVGNQSRVLRNDMFQFLLKNVQILPTATKPQTPPAATGVQPQNSPGDL